MTVKCYTVAKVHRSDVEVALSDDPKDGATMHEEVSVKIITPVLGTLVQCEKVRDTMNAWFPDNECVVLNVAEGVGL